MLRVYLVLFVILTLVRSLWTGHIGSRIGENDKRLIKTGPERYRVIEEKDKAKFKKSGIGFVDVTNKVSVHEEVERGALERADRSFLDSIVLLGAKQIKQLRKPLPKYEYPKRAYFKSKVDQINTMIDLEFMRSRLGYFSSFYSRYYRSSYGYESGLWLKQQVKEIVKNAGSDIGVKTFEHEDWDQFSIIVRMQGENPEKVVVSSHQDSINLLFPKLLRAPGADDNGSGTITCLEALRLLSNEYGKEFKPRNTLEFHFYSAEEGGLLGSMDIFDEYFKKHEVILGVLQQDMTGYSAGTKTANVEPHFGLIEDYTSTNLNEFVKLMIHEYCQIPYRTTHCGYACSDHASAIEYGYPASFLCESEIKYDSKFIHTVLDTPDRLDFELIAQHVKLTVAFAFELSMAATPLAF